MKKINRLSLNEIFKKESFHLIFLEELNTINELIKYKSNLKPSLNRDICVLP